PAACRLPPGLVAPCSAAGRAGEVGAALPPRPPPPHAASPTIDARGRIASQPPIDRRGDGQAASTGKERGASHPSLVAERISMSPGTLASVGAGPPAVNWRGQRAGVPSGAPVRLSPVRSIDAALAGQNGRAPPAGPRLDPSRDMPDGRSLSLSREAADAPGRRRSTLLERERGARHPRCASSSEGPSSVRRRNRGDRRLRASRREPRGPLRARAPPADPTPDRPAPRSDPRLARSRAPRG